MATIYDAELALVFLSEAIIAYPELRKKFEEYYKTNKYRFYERARHSVHYKHYNMGDNRLETEVAMKRTFGILLSAEDDDGIQEFVCKAIQNANPSFEMIVAKPRKSSVESLLPTSSENKAVSYVARNAPIRFLAYLFYLKYGADSSNEIVNMTLAYAHDMDVKMSHHNKESYVKAYSQPRTTTVITKRIRNVTSRIRTGVDVSCFIDFGDKFLLKQNFVPSNQELYNYIEDYFMRGKEESEDIIRAITFARFVAGILNVNGAGISGQLGNIGITKEEEEMIITILAFSTFAKASKHEGWRIKISDYLLGVILMLMAKEMSQMKTFYFRNNSETQFLELQRLENLIDDKDLEIERLKAELAKASELSARQREEIRQLTDEAYKEEKDAIKPFASEIADLNVKIRELTNELEAEQAKTPELNALRELAFDLQTEFVPPETGIGLTDLLQHKKLIIVGGHVNWRNKMKEKYPNIVILDGHNVSIDVSAFDKADYIIFQTSNMSHQVYYKAINYLRNRKLRFGYLGRCKNPDLLEAEIVSVVSGKW